MCAIPAWTFANPSRISASSESLRRGEPVDPAGEPRVHPGDPVLEGGQPQLDGRHPALQPVEPVAVLDLGVAQRLQEAALGPQLGCARR